MADTQVPVKEFEYDQLVHAALESEEQVTILFWNAFDICISDAINYVRYRRNK